MVKSMYCSCRGLEFILMPTAQGLQCPLLVFVATDCTHAQAHTHTYTHTHREIIKNIFK